MTPATSGRRIVGGRYEVLHEIARGGMAVVYEAVHLLSRRRVALKVLFRSLGDADDLARSRFLREVSAPAQIGHPGIVEVYDAGFDEDGSPFVAMELLEGETIRTRLTRSRYAIADALELFERVLEPLAAAHDRGIVHRDLKPDNIFLAQVHGKEVVKLLDFGIARKQSEDGHVTGTGVALGTPHYMAPEQAMSARDATPAADVWSIGAMMYEAMAGRTPFQGATASAIVVQVCTQDHPPLARTAPQVPAALATLIDRCLSKNPELRPGSAGDLLTEVRRMRRQQIVPVTAPMSETPSGGGPQGPASWTGWGGAAPTPPPSHASPGTHGGATTPGGPPSFGGGAAAWGGASQGGGPTTPGGPPSMTGGPVSHAGPSPVHAAPPGSHPGMSPAPGSGSGPWASGPGTPAASLGVAVSPPQKKRSLLLPLLLLFGLLTLAGTVVVVALVLASRSDPVVAGAGTGTVRIVTDVPSAELFVDGASFGVVLSGREVVLSAGPHQLELRQGASVLATRGVTILSGQTIDAHMQGALAVPPPLPPTPVRQTRVVPGFLGPGDQTIPTGEYADLHRFQWTASRTVKLEAKSTQFDTYLIVQTPSGQRHENDDQPNGARDAMIELYTLEAGDYAITVTSYQAGETGAYELHVTE